ncbi:MAG TPA: hypothetical protein VF697_05490, partial [Archangium sp.]
HPLRVLVVYDFKFRCAGTSPPDWSNYPDGHPHAGYSQKRMYEKALNSQAWRVTPDWGIFP